MGEKMMNAKLDYSSGQSYSQSFSNLKVKVTRTSSGKRVSFSFKANGDSSYASYSLPLDKSRLLAHAILTACEGELLQPVEFQVDESSAKPIAA